MAIDEQLVAVVQDALRHIPPDARETWVRMGMACHSAGDELFWVWDQWSQGSEKYDERTAQIVWRSFKQGPVSVLSLFKTARQHGWQGDIDSEFAGKGNEPRRRDDDRRAWNKERMDRQKRFQDWYTLAKEHTTTGPSPYLMRKGFHDFEARASLLPSAAGDGDLTVVRYYDPLLKHLRGAQIISADGTKRTIRGSSMSGVVTETDSRIFDRTDRVAGLILCEGFATQRALSLAKPKWNHTLGPWAVVGVGSSSNFPKGLARLLMRKDCERLKVMLVCDDDEPTKDTIYETLGASEWYARQALQQQARGRQHKRFSLWCVRKPGDSTAYGYDFADLYLQDREAATELLRERIKEWETRFI